MHKIDGKKLCGEDINNLFNFEINKNEKIEIETDSRIIKENQIFLPLIGERFDGHNFINEVIEKGIKFSFCNLNKKEKINPKYFKKIIFVEDTLITYHAIANYFRKKVNPIVIGITGSSGKTTTKDLLECVISEKFKTYKTRKNFNNEIGLPKTILEMPEDTEVLILEMAMRNKGEISLLSKTAEPNIAIITNIGSAHIGILGSKENIRDAKIEILEYLKKDGIAILHNDLLIKEKINENWSGKTIFYYIDDAENIEIINGKTNFKFKKDIFQIGVIGKVHIENSICGILSGTELGMTMEEIKRGLLKFQIPEGRGNIIKLKNNIFIVNETYNANPDSVKEAFNNLLLFESKYKKIFILGELKELGKHEEKFLLELKDFFYSKKQNIDKIIVIGESLKPLTMKNNNWIISVNSIEECNKQFENENLHNTVITIKASRAAALEKIVEYIVEKYKS